jgi:hypothetical protein
MKEKDKNDKQNAGGSSKSGGQGGQQTKSGGRQGGKSSSGNKGSRSGDK